MAVVRVRWVRLCHQEIAVYDHRESLVGNQVFHRISRGFELDTTHPVLESTLKGVTRSLSGVGNQADVRRPVSWAMLLTGETLIPAWRNGGRVL